MSLIQINGHTKDKSGMAGTIIGRRYSFFVRYRTDNNW
jgi:hypothetical protein